MLYRVHLAEVGFELTALVVICIDRTCSYKSNYHTITTMTAPERKLTHTHIHIYLYIKI